MPEDHLEFLEMPVPQAPLGCRDPQVLQESQASLVVKVNQEHLVKSFLQLALILWPSLDLQDQLDLQVLLDHLVCRVQLALLVSQDNQDLRESEEKRERGGRRGSQQTLPQWLDLVVHKDLQDLLEYLVLRVLLVSLKRVPQDPEVLLESQVSANLDLQARKERLGALCRHQKPSLLDHPDLQDPRGRKGHRVSQDHKGTKVNQDNQAFQEAPETQVLVSQVSLELKAHQVQTGHRDLKVIREIQDLQESPQVLASESTSLDLLGLRGHQAHLDMQWTGWLMMSPAESWPTSTVQAEVMTGPQALLVLRVHLAPSLSVTLSASYRERT